MSLDQYFLKGSDKMPKAKKIAPKSSAISGVEQDVNVDDVSVNSREEESSNFEPGKSRLPEGTEGSDPVHFIEKWLPDYLKITTKAGRIKLDRAHRSLAPLPGPTQRPRPVIIKFHNFTDKQRVLNAARHVGTDHDPRGALMQDREFHSSMIILRW